MKLKNKKTGEIIEFDAILPVKDVADDSVAHLEYGSLAELNEEWEDASEEPKGFWSINGDVTIEHFDRLNENDLCKKIGNYFETKEEAELAVRKLKAWKRLKDKGFRFGGHDDRDRGQLGDIVIYAEMPAEWFCCNAVQEDLNLLFSGGEE